MNYTYKKKPNSKIRLFANNITPITDINLQIQNKQNLNYFNKPEKVFDTESFDKIYKESLEMGIIKEY